MDGQLLQEAEKERDGIPASPALSDISVFSALDHRYGWSVAAGGGEREGGSPALSDISVFSALDHRYGWSASSCIWWRKRRRDSPPDPPSRKSMFSSLDHKYNYFTDTFVPSD
jgi:hypothetical protein